MSKEVWNSQISHFSDKYRIIAIDLAGFGDSSSIVPPDSYAGHARDVHDLLQHLQISNVHLVGWSMGALVAINFADLFHPELNTLTLVNANANGIRSADFPWGIESGTLSAMMETLEQDPAFMAEKFVTQILSGSTDKALYEKILNIVNQTTPEVALHHLRLAIESDSRAMLGSIRSPTLLINGELDIFSTTQANEYMAQHIKQVTWTEIPRTGHAPFLTEPVKFNHCLEHFLRNAAS